MAVILKPNTCVILRANKGCNQGEIFVVVCKQGNAVQNTVL